MDLESLSPLNLSQRHCAYLAVVVLVVYLIGLCFFNYYFHPVSHIPGPWIAAISPLWLMWAVHGKKLNNDLQRLHSKYGPVVRIAPNELSFATVEAQRTIHNPGPELSGYFTKKGTVESMLGKIAWPADNVLTTTEPTAHRRLRSALLPAFTSKALLEQEMVQQHHLAKAIDSLHAIASEGAVTNITHHFSTLVWDIIGDLSFGEPLLRDQKRNFEVLKTTYCQISPLLEALHYLAGIPLLGSFVRLSIMLIPHLFKLPTNILPRTKLRECMDRRDGRKDFLTAIMGSKESGVNLTNAEIRSNSSLLVMVGYDTTATTLSATFYYLLRDPMQMKKLQQELRTEYKHIDEIKSQSLLRLPFLNGCIQEALRLLPPANGKGTNRTSPGAIINGIFIPAGVNVSADMYTIQRSPTYWAEAEEFRPERWFDHGPGSVFEHDLRSSHRPFLLGPRVCLGREMALQTLRLTIAKFAFRYNLEMINRGDYVWERDTDSSYLWIGYRLMVKVNPYV